MLEDCGCHHIKHVKNKRIQCALPNGDNPSSCQVVLDEQLGGIVNTRNDYPGGDIFSLIMYLRKCEFNEAFKWCCHKLGFDCSYTHSKPLVNETYSFLNKFFKKSICNEKEPEENTVLPDNIMDEFINIPHKYFVDEGISENSQRKFNVGYDIFDNRIVFPIYSDTGEIVGVKGRTLRNDYKELRIPKYLSYYPYAGRLNLFGLYQNYWNIASKDEVIIVESEKAVMQADSMGVDNVVALSKKKISHEQFIKLLQLNVNLVFALDNDVDIEYIKEMASEFKCLTHIYVITDCFGLTGEKSSPFDHGKEVWEALYECREKIM